MFGTVLVANRGEIAVRIIRTLHRLGVRSIAVYSEADAAAPHVSLADEAVLLGPDDARESYLSIERVIAAALASGADAVHPGYGFLSENADFAQACETAGLVFVGPASDTIRLMGDKRAAKEAASALGVPTVPGFHGAGASDEQLTAAAVDVRFPLIVKPAAGGGGMGMHVVADPGELPAALAAARREASAAFGDDGLLLEQYVAAARHVEVQVLGDGHGAVVHLGDRDCSVQRRHQKVIEEAPAPFLPDGVRHALEKHAVSLAAAARYRGVGTVEFVVDARDPARHYFLEMNTRLQVEHPVTEMVTGLDLVELQLAVAADGALPISQADVVIDGAAMEARVYAEDGHHGFLPSSGTLVRYREPDSVRVDSGVRAGSVVSTSYDPLLLKVVAVGPSRETAVRRLDEALADTVVHGVAHNIGALRALLHNDDLREGRFTTSLIAESGIGSPGPAPAHLAVAAALVLAAESQSSVAGSPWGASPGWRVGALSPTVIRLEDEDARIVTVSVSGPVAGCRVTVDDDVPVDASVRLSGDGHAAVTLDGLLHACVATVVPGTDTRVIVGVGGDAWTYRRARRVPLRQAHGDGSNEGEAAIRTPMPGSVVLMHGAVGQKVGAGDVIAVVEAMKMEYPLRSPVAGTVTAVAVSAGEQVTRNQVVAVVEIEEAP